MMQLHTVRTELGGHPSKYDFDGILAEVRSFFVPRAEKLGEEGQGFDKRSPNGIWIDG
ncbi:hypothetical protein ACFSC3_15755 [Sphingomonas floccifaciens]|uniref:Uncharacterized protein n=2 Tax=Sphingomonas floccifaciens TaxID=1844115 RepID=A0ABW4NFU4_9SPHN